MSRRYVALEPIIGRCEGSPHACAAKLKRYVCVLQELEKGTYSSGYLKRERRSWQETFLRKVLHGTRTNRPRPQYLHLFSRRPSAVWVLVRVLV
jgi:hypothetical protein